jgi:hypothetical protein
MRLRATAKRIWCGRWRALTPLPHPPSGYQRTYTLDVPGPMDVKFNRDWWWPLALTSLFAYWVPVTRTRPGYWNRSKRSLMLDWLVGLPVGRYSLYPAHEAVHAVLLWAYTHERPLTRLVPPINGYAYAVAPHWYLPRNQSLVVALAPVIVLSVGMLIVAPKVHTRALPVLGFALAHNIAASAGDMYVVWLLSQRPVTCYTNITTQRFTIWDLAEG